MSGVQLKTAAELALQREAGRLLTQVFAMLDTAITAGISTLQINELAERYIVDELQARPASKGQYGFAFVLNTSVNDVVCHGVPSATQLLKDGDIVNVDITLEKHGFIADSSKMYLIGEVAPAAFPGPHGARIEVRDLIVPDALGAQLERQLDLRRVSVCVKAGRRG